MTPHDSAAKSEREHVAPGPSEGRAAPARSAASVASSARDVLARENAEDALREYARLAFGWNAPDDEHTRLSLQGMVQRVIRAYEDGSLRD